MKFFWVFHFNKILFSHSWTSTNKLLLGSDWRGPKAILKSLIKVKVKPIQSTKGQRVLLLKSQYFFFYYKQRIVQTSKTKAQSKYGKLEKVLSNFTSNTKGPHPSCANHVSHFPCVLVSYFHNLTRQCSFGKKEERNQKKKKTRKCTMILFVLKFFDFVYLLNITDLIACKLSRHLKFDSLYIIRSKR